MSSWNNLPIELLHHIFSFLDDRDSVENPLFETDYVLPPPKDAFECQLTCKRWSRPAQRLIYKAVQINGVDQFKSFIQTLQQDSQDEVRLMVEAIGIDYENVKVENSLITTLIRSCPNVKTVKTSETPQKNFWVLLMSERYEGNWKKLQSMPASSDRPYDKVTSSVQNYELASWTMRDSLEKLTVYDWLTFSDTNINRLEQFKNLKHLCLSLKNYRTFFNMGKQLQECHLLQSLHVENKLMPPSASSQGQNNVSTYINDLSLAIVYPHIKVLQIFDMVANDNTISYLMRAFPKLDELRIYFATTLCSLLPETDKADILPLSADISIQFLKYLIRIPDFDVDNITIEKPADVLKGFYGNVKDVNIEYTLCDGQHEGSSHLRLSHIDAGNKEKLTLTQDRKSKTKTDVIYEIGEDPTTLPHMDLIDTLGHGLTKLSIYMGEIEDDMISDNLDFASAGYYVDQIFQKCPNIYYLILASTFLLRSNPGSLQVEKRISFQTWCILQDFINPDFLTAISQRCDYIGNFDISSCRFVNPDGSDLHNPTNVKIDMPSTMFSKITWEVNNNLFDDDTPLPNFFLKLEENNRPSRYFTGNAIEFTTCSKEAYQDSLIDGSESFSIFIRCKELCYFHINTADYNMIIDIDYDECSFDVRDNYYFRCV